MATLESRPQSKTLISGARESMEGYAVYFPIYREIHPDAFFRHLADIRFDCFRCHKIRRHPYIQDPGCLMGRHYTCTDGENNLS